MRYVLYAVFAVIGLVVFLLVIDLVNQGVAERRIKEARFYLEGPNPDEASKLAARAIRKLQKYPTVQGARRDRTIVAGRDVLHDGLSGIFAEQYARDLRFHPGPQWDICEARARVTDESICIDAAAEAARRVAHNSFITERVQDGVGLLEECVQYETRPEIAAVCRDKAGQWLGEESAALLEKGQAINAAKIIQACVARPDSWGPSEQCLNDWHVTVRRARNALIPKYRSCQAVKFYNDMPEGIPADDREEAEAERAELRSTTALIETLFHYDVMEFAPATRYWGRGEESTKYHLAQLMTPKGYTLQWLEEEHPKGAWDACEPAYAGAIEVHEVRGRMVQAFKKEALTVRVQGQLRLHDTATGRPWIEESVEGREPKDWFRDEEMFLDQAAICRESSWQDAHAQMKKWEIEGPPEA